MRLCERVIFVVLLMTMSMQSWLLQASPLRVPSYDLMIQEYNEKDEEAAYYKLALSKNKKINGVWLFEKEEKIKAKRIKTLYKIESDDNIKDIARYYDTWVNNKKDEILFHCQSRQCGSSNQWANKYFQEKRVYGPESNQWYWLFKRGDVFVAMYLIEPGNGRVYLMVHQYWPDYDDNQKRQSNHSAAVWKSDSCDGLMKQWHAQNKKVHKDDASYYLLTVSLPNDDGQKASIAEAASCAKKIEDLANNSLSVKYVGLGVLGRQLHPVEKAVFSLSLH